jgi:hypothetical protein
MVIEETKGVAKELVICDFGICEKNELNYIKEINRIELGKSVGIDIDSLEISPTVPSSVRVPARLNLRQATATPGRRMATNNRLLDALVSNPGFRQRPPTLEMPSSAKFRDDLSDAARGLDEGPRLVGLDPPSRPGVRALGAGLNALGGVSSALQILNGPDTLDQIAMARANENTPTGEYTLPYSAKGGTGRFAIVYDDDPGILGFYWLLGIGKGNFRKVYRTGPLKGTEEAISKEEAENYAEKLDKIHGYSPFTGRYYRPLPRHRRPAWVTPYDIGEGI